MGERVQVPGSTLKVDLDKVRGFHRRGRASSARSLQASTREAERTSPPKRRPISPTSLAQRRKINLAPVCIVCGAERSDSVAIDPAHVCPRSLGGCDDPDCTVGLCRTFAGGCHVAYDEGKLDLLPYLEHEGRYRREQAHAVLHLGIEAAWARTNPRAHRRVTEVLARG